MKKILNTLGSDPEIAITNNGHIVPAGKFLELFGKENLINREYDDEGQVTHGYRLVLAPDLSIYEDGMSWEINMEPSTDIGTMVERFRRALSTSYRMCERFGYELTILPMIPVTQQDVDEGGVVCARFGCDPDETIYDDKFDPARVDARNHLARYFGCHLHSGMTPYMIKRGGLSWVMSNMKTIISAYDLLVGIPNVIIGSTEQSFLRRKVYGRAGRHRLQIPYGWEYRTPDNYIMKSPELLGTFFHLSRVATFLAEDHELVETLVNRVGNERLFNIITDCDLDRALDAWNNVIKPETMNLSNKLTVDKYGERAFSEVCVNSATIQFNKFEDNWRLND
jgi:hypothetical protein